MERVTSRKNSIIIKLRALGRDRSCRREQGLFLCDGEKLLCEAVSAGAELDCVLWCEGAGESFVLPAGTQQISAPLDLVQYVSPLKNSTGPVFSVKLPQNGEQGRLKNAIVLENLQDPGNVGTVLRTAAAFDIDTVLLAGECADLFNPKTVRSTMGAIFRQNVRELSYEELEKLLCKNELAMYGAALSESARNIHEVNLKNAAVAIGSEGSGLSERLLNLCSERIIIPMQPESESLNAAVAASVAMWEMYRKGEF